MSDLYAVLYCTEDFDQTFLYSNLQQSVEQVKKIYEINAGKNAYKEDEYHRNENKQYLSDWLHLEEDGRKIRYENIGNHSHKSYRRSWAYYKPKLIWEPAKPWAFACIVKVKCDGKINSDKLITTGYIKCENRNLYRVLSSSRSEMWVYDVKNYSDYEKMEYDLTEDYTPWNLEIIGDRVAFYSYGTITDIAEIDSYEYFPNEPSEEENIILLSKTDYVMHRKQVRRKVTEGLVKAGRTIPEFTGR